MDAEGDGIMTVGGRATLPTVYMQDETVIDGKAAANLRYRTRSQESAGTPADKGSSSRYQPTFATPGSKTFHDIMCKVVHDSPDSGFSADDSSFMSVTTPLTSPEGNMGTPPCRYAVLDKPRMEFREEKLDSPIEFIQRRYRNRNQALFDTESISLSHVLPVAVVLIILASSVFTILSLQSAVTRGFSDVGDMMPKNGKYASMEFAIRKRREALEREGKLLPEDIKGDDGEALGGKKAAIQFAYELRRQEGQQDGGGDSDEEDTTMDALIQNIQDIYEDKNIGMSNDKREKLLQKLSEFGHLTTTDLKPVAENSGNDEKNGKIQTDQQLEPVLPNGKQQSADKRNVTKTKPMFRQQPQTPVKTPFEDFQSDLGDMVAFDDGDEDDPFRFV